MMQQLRGSQQPVMGSCWEEVATGEAEAKAEAAIVTVMGSGR